MVWVKQDNMLLHLLIISLISVLNALTFFLPTVTALPFGIDTILTTGMGYIVFIIGVFPPLGIMLNGLIFYYGFKLSLKLVAMIPILRGMLHK